MKQPPISLHRRAVLRRAGELLVAAPLPAWLAACSSPPRTDHHLLRDAGPAPAPVAGARVDRVLLLSSAPAPTLYETERMVFSADGSSRSYFQLGFWSDRPARRVTLLAQERLERTQAFRDVALASSGLRGELLLTLRLEALYLDDAAQPAQAQVSLSAELLDWRQRRPLGRERFERAQAAATRDAAGFAAAASQALGALLDDLARWTIGAARPA
jgi:ABC-type uncharacterized transport system auxiliary subunit